MSAQPIDRHALDVSLDLVADESGHYTGTTSPAYANMVGPFGGNTAAVLLQAALRHPDRIGDPVSLTVNFAGPIADGEFTVTARPVRTNRSTQHWSIELIQDDAPATTATAVFAVRRETWASTEAPMPQVPASADVAATPFPPMVEWPKNYEMRWIAGEVPTQFMTDGAVTENPDSTTTMWIRDAPPRPLDFPALTAICDTFYPRVFLRRGRPMAASTVTFTVYFHADAALLTENGTEPVLATARASAFGRGYFDQVAEIWSATGALLATTHQLVYFKE